MTKRALVCGAGGFIGSHLAARLSRDGYHVTGADAVEPRFAPSAADEFVVGDLRDEAHCRSIFRRGFDVVFQLAADMGGAGYIFTGENDATIVANSARINMNVLDAAIAHGKPHVFFSSSACVYADQAELRQAPECREPDAYPAYPDSEYGWEKLFAERMYLTYNRCHGLPVSVARFHNIFGPLGTWNDGREKAPAAMCRKVAEADDGGSIEIWGDGEQVRSFLYIDECVEGVLRMVDAGVTGPLNIGSDASVTINELARLAMKIAGKSLTLRHVPGPIGVNGRNSDNTLIEQTLGWKPDSRLEPGLEKTYRWIESQVRDQAQARKSAADA